MQNNINNFQNYNIKDCNDFNIINRIDDLLKEAHLLNCVRKQLNTANMFP